MLPRLTHPCPVSSTPHLSGRGRRYYRPRGGGYDRFPPSGKKRSGGSWYPSVTTPPRLPCWRSRTVWLEQINIWISTPEGEQLRRHWKISQATLLDVANAFSTYADSTTGRHVHVSHITLAGRLGCSSKTVQRAYHLLQDAAFIVEVNQGRYLTTAERADALATHGKPQIRIANAFHCTQPPASNVHLPLEPSGSRVNICLFNSSKRSWRCDRAASRPAKKRKTPRPKIKYPLPIQLLAASLAQRLPWLARSHIGNLCRALHTLGLDANTWTAAGLLERIDTHNHQHGRTQPNPSNVRNPLGLFIHQVRRALAETTPPPPRNHTLHQARQHQAQQHHAWAQQQAAAASAETAETYINQIRRQLRLKHHQKL